MMLNSILNRFNKGFTLIEIIIALALTGIIISIILSLLASSIAIFHSNDKDIEIQQQGQFIIGFLEEKIMESCGIIYLQDTNGNTKHDTSEKVNIKKIIFKNYPEATDKGYIFQLNKDTDSSTYNLKYGIGLSGTATVEAGNYIEKIEVVPIPSDKNYTEARGLSISLSFNLNGQKKSFKTQLFFRNYQRR